MTTKVLKEGDEEKSDDPRDKGWAWVVALAVGLFTILLQGTVKTFGQLYLEWYLLYQESPTLTSWVASLFTLMLTVLSPLAGYTRDRYSAKNARRIVFVCGILLSVCFFVTGWMNSLIGVMVVFGLFGGVLVAVIDAPILSLLSQYFVKKRSTANGVAFSCSSLGGLLLPLIIARTNEEYGVRGSMMILSGLWLNVLVIAAAMIPLPALVYSMEITQDTNVVESEDKKLRDLNQTSAVSQVVLISVINLEDNNTGVPMKEPFENNVSVNTMDEPSKRKDHRGPVTLDEPQVFRSVEHVRDDPSVQPPRTTKEMEMESKNEIHKESSSNPLVKGFTDYIRFLRTPHLGSLMLALFFGSFAYYNQFFIFPPLATELDMSKITASNILAIAGVSELVGRLLVGVIADRLGKKKIWIIVVSTGCSFIIGLIVRLGLNKTILFVYAPLFGLFGGLLTPLVIPLTLDVVPPHCGGSAAGLFVLISGGGISIGMPIISAVYEKTSSYKDGFMICICANAVALGFLIIHVIGRFIQCRKPRHIGPVL